MSPGGKLHPDDCDCGREHAHALVHGLSRRWGRSRRRRALLTLLATALVLTVLLLLLRGSPG